MDILGSLMFLFGGATSFGLSLLLLFNIVKNRENTKAPNKIYPFMFYSLVASVAGSLISLELLNFAIVVLCSLQLLLFASVYFLYSKYGIKLSLSSSKSQPNDKSEQQLQPLKTIDQEKEQPSRYRELNEKFVNQPDKYKERNAELAEKKKQQEILANQEEIRKQEELIQAAVNQRFQQMQQPPVKRKEAGLFHQGIFCPNCRGLDVQFMQNKRKKFSVGKAVVGGALAGGIGAAAGLAGKKGKKNQWRCNDCGETFYSKK